MSVFDDIQEEMAPHTPMEIKQENIKELSDLLLGACKERICPCGKFLACKGL